jgi:RHS repeat-associated protein
MRRLLLFTIVAVLALATGTSASAGRQAAVTQTNEAAPFSSSLVVPGVNSLDGQREALDAQTARRANPAAVSARQASRNAFRGMSAARAASLTHETFPQILAVDGRRVLPAGQRITRYLGDDAARVELAGHRHAVVESTVPIAAMNASGNHVPLDLALRATDDAFQPSVAATGVRIPKHLDAGVQLTDSGLTVTPVQNAHGSQGTLDGAAVLYANTQTDTDTLVKPIAQGAELDAMLRSPASPERISFTVTGPGRVKLAQVAGGAVSVAIDGSLLAIVTPPSAQDAAGTSVPVSMSAHGNRITLAVAHRAGDYQYPIEVDPNVTDTKLLWNYELYNTSNWRFGDSSYFTGRSEMSSLNDEANWPYPRGAWGAWAYETQGESRIYAFGAETSSSSAGSDIENRLFIVGHGGEEVALALPSNYGASWNAMCTAGCVGGTNNNAAEFFQVATNEGSSFLTAMYRVEVDIAQEAPPHIAPDTNPEDTYVEGKPNLALTGAWVSEYDGYFGVRAEDPGIGVSEVKFRSPNVPGWEVADKSRQSWEGGYEGCQGVQCSPHVEWAAPTWWAREAPYLPEGKDTVEATASDAVGLTGTSSFEVKVDRAAPHNLTITGLPANSEIGDGVYHVKATASDGSGTVPSSGVQPVSVAIDGKVVGTAKGGCSVGPCTTSGEWAISGSEYAVGQHTLKFTATDYAGNPATIEQPIFVTRSTTPVAVGPGQVNPESGELGLQASDVSIASPGGALTVERSFGSQHVTAGAEGALGPDWSLDLGGARNLTKLPDGSVLLSDGGSLQSVFTPKGAGEYTPPKGDENLKLAESTVAGKVQFALTNNGGSVTTFTLPAGGTGNTWVPTREAGPNNTNVATFAYKVVGSLIEPSEELAPVAANVTCTTELVKGCRALKFVYATSTTATGESQSGWGDYLNRLKQVTFTAWNPATSAMSTTAVAQYQYDSTGRLRAEWDPRVSPAVKNTYGYDPAQRVVSVTPGGEQPWLFNYGTTTGDVRTGRLLSVTRPAPATAAGTGITPANTAAPTLSGTKAVEGAKLTVTNGTWSNTPLAYSYQWQECSTYAEAEVCAAITGATNASYVPVYHTAKHWLKVAVTAINANGSATATTAVTTSIYPDPYMVKSSEFGATGSGNGQLNAAEGIATDASGNVWVADTMNHRIEKFSATGTFIAAYGKAGSGSEELGLPWGLSIDNRGDVWITDKGNKRVTALSPSTGKFLGSFTTESTPVGISVIPDPYISGEYLIYVSEENNHISAHVGTGPSGARLWALPYGSTGSGQGQFTLPAGMTYDPTPTTQELFIVDTNNHRVQGFVPQSSSLVWAAQFGTLGSGEGQFQAPTAIDYQAGFLFVDDSANGRVQKFIEGSPQTVAPVAVDSYNETGTGTTGVALYPHNAAGSMYVLNKTTNKISRWVSATRPVTPPTPPIPGTSAVWTLEYGVPVSGSGAPYSLSSTEAAKWGQTDNPVEAMAVLPPDSPQGWPASSYGRATVYYLDGDGHTVNIATPGGGISTMEFNAKNDVVRSLSADARKTALAAGSTSAEVSKTLDSQSTYSEDGSELLSTTGPQHNVKLSNGTQVSARHRTKYFYDEGAPGTGGPYHLVTKMTEGALLSGGTEEDVHTTTTSYSGQEGLGWKLHEPTSITTDPSGLKLVRTKFYEAATGYVTDEISPGGNQAGGDSHDNQTVYYTALANAKVAACGLHPEFANMPCQAKLAKQPETARIPNPPIVTQTYNLWDEALETTGLVGAESRKVTDTYDAAGRLHTTAVASSTGTALPATTLGYDPATGKLTTSSATEGTTTRTITNAYDKWGELTGYTDADGALAEYSYDVDGRPLTSKDGKGSQTYTYDPTTGLPSSLVDTAAGTFTATYDVEGKPLTQLYPNGMTAKYTYDETGQATKLEYVKTTECSTECTWYSDSVVPSITGQWLSQSSSLSSQAYKYDNAARLTQVQDTPAAGGCTTRLYGFDADTNRTSQTTRSPGTGGVCATEGGTVVSHTYDPADRLIDTGATYDTFGDITSLPAGDAGGTTLSSSYYVNGTLASQTQNGQTNGYHLDPSGRQREVVATGHTALTSVEHYAGPGDGPSWVAEGTTGWTRNIPGIVGGLVATQTNGESPVLQVENLHGDIVATASTSVAAKALASTSDTSEYGVPRTATPPKYSWLGASERATTLPTGVVAMGARSYVPQIGRFLQTDPVPGGSANAYSYTSGDPVNESDPSGESSTGLSGWLTEVNNGIAQQVVVREAQREAAARAEAEAAAAAAVAAAAATTAEYAAGPAADSELGETFGWGLEEGGVEAGELEEWILGPARGLGGRLDSVRLFSGKEWQPWPKGIKVLAKIGGAIKKFVNGKACDAAAWTSIATAPWAPVETVVEKGLVIVGGAALKEKCG